MAREKNKKTAESSDDFRSLTDCHPFFSRFIPMFVKAQEKVNKHTL